MIAKVGDNYVQFARSIGKNKTIRLMFTNEGEFVIGDGPVKKVTKGGKVYLDTPTCDFIKKFAGTDHVPVKE